MEDRRRERQSRRGAQSARFERKGEPQADEDDADVLDGVVREQTLQIVFHQRIQDTEQSGDAGDQQYRNAPPPCRGTCEVEDEPHETIDRHLRHDPAHQCRDMTRRGRVREREPRVQRHQTRFGAGPDQRQQQNDRAHAGRADTTDRFERVSALRSGEQAERQQQREGTARGHDEINEGGAPVFGRTVLAHHERPGCERHEFPADQERKRILRQQHQIHAGDERRVERHDPLRFAGVCTVADCIAAHDRGGQVDDDGECGAQRIEPEECAGERQPDGNLDGLEPRSRREQRDQRHAREPGTDSQAGCVDEPAPERTARREDPEHREREQDSDAACRQLAQAARA